jgi:hypothetical protein
VAAKPSVGEYDATTGKAINPSFITGLSFPYGLAVSGNTLFVANDSVVGEYDATTGKAINPSFIMGLNYPSGLALSGSTLFVANYGCRFQLIRRLISHFRVRFFQLNRF